LLIIIVVARLLGRLLYAADTPELRSLLPLQPIVGESQRSAALIARRLLDFRHFYPLYLVDLHLHIWNALEVRPYLLQGIIVSFVYRYFQ
jgi:hypothetical protein